MKLHTLALPFGLGYKVQLTQTEKNKTHCVNCPLVKKGEKALFGSTVLTQEDRRTRG